MITLFKIFESITTPPKIGDYVLIDSNLFHNYYRNELFCEYINSNIGQVIEIKITQDRFKFNENSVVVKFENIPKELSFFGDNFFDRNNNRTCSISTLKCWSSNKEELETLITAKKYNL